MQRDTKKQKKNKKTYNSYAYELSKERAIIAEAKNSYRKSVERIAKLGFERK